MSKKQFKAESKKLLDMMINSIYTHKEIFLRELISNASDAIDKLYFRSLTDNTVGLEKGDFRIKITPDKENRTLTIEDNGCGMTADELENNLGTIAKSGSLDFKKNMDEKTDVEIIGQFGVGFYSAFMVSDKVTVLSRAFGEEKANLWVSEGAEGYTVETAEKETPGTVITLYIKEDTEADKYSEYLDTYRLSAIVRKYSDYIRYPVMMDVETSKPVDGKDGEYETVTETRTLNSMIPLWRKNKNEIEADEYDAFYQDKFFDFEKPAKVIHSKVEGQATYDALIFIPKRAPYDYYSKNYEKGLQLFSNGVLIMDKCPDLLPDYFGFVKGLVDSADLSLNISREVLQHDYQLKLIAKTVEKKIKSELQSMLRNDRETYEEFYKSFGMQLKFGVYENYGAHKEVLKDLIMFVSSYEDKLTTLAEYVERMKDSQDKIYYACGETKAKIDMLPQVEAVKDKGYEILYFTDNVDEFAIQMLMTYEDKHFVNVCADKLDLDTDEEKEELRKENESAKDLLAKMKEILGESVTEVRFTNSLKKHVSCLTSEGMLSTEMEKVLNAMPGATGIKAETVLEINASHPVAKKIRELDGDALEKYTKLLYMQARLIGGLSVEDPAEFCSLVSELME